MRRNWPESGRLPEGKTLSRHRCQEIRTWGHFAQVTATRVIDRGFFRINADCLPRVREMSRGTVAESAMYRYLQEEQEVEARGNGLSKAKRGLSDLQQIPPAILTCMKSGGRKTPVCSVALSSDTEWSSRLYHWPQGHKAFPVRIVGRVVPRPASGGHIHIPAPSVP
jgi:hypothetical protein